MMAGNRKKELGRKGRKRGKEREKERELVRDKVKVFIHIHMSSVSRMILDQ